MSERWLPVVGWEGLYEVSDHGRLRSIDRVIDVPCRWGGSMKRRLQGRILNPIWATAHGKYRTGKLGYYQVCLGNGEGVLTIWRVHRLVLTVFVGPCPEGHEGAHIDGDTRNNRLANLAWKTAKENSADRIRHGRQTRKSGCCPQDPVTGRFARVAA